MPGEVKATSFGKLYGAYARDVCRFALYWCGDTALAEDITAETFLRVWIAKQPVRLHRGHFAILTGGQSTARAIWASLARLDRLSREPSCKSLI
ncbi:MAG: sigma factor [Bryobacteraceae bacterium]|jgi:hypothetical protein